MNCYLLILIIYLQTVNVYTLNTRFAQLSYKYHLSSGIRSFEYCNCVIHNINYGHDNLHFAH